MAGKLVFISYRRNESIVEARAVYERLERDFPGQIFIDLGTLEYGEDFADVIAHQLDGCRVMLVLIGPTWLTAESTSGRRRIDEPSDFVRIEVRAAIDRKIRLIPVLFNAATIPQESDLPVDLAGLTRRHAMHLDFRRFDADIVSLCDVIQRVLSAPERETIAFGAPPPAPVVEGSQVRGSDAKSATGATDARRAKPAWRRLGWIAAPFLLAAVAVIGVIALGGRSPISPVRRGTPSPAAAGVTRSAEGASTDEKPLMSPSAKWRVHSQGTFKLDSTYFVFLDTGKIVTELRDADLSFVYGEEGGPHLSPQNGAAFARTKTGSMDQCERTKLQTAPYPVARFARGAQFCARTKSGRPSFFRIADLSGEGNNRTISFEYTTWNRE